MTTGPNAAELDAESRAEFQGSRQVCLPKFRQSITLKRRDKHMVAKPKRPHPCPPSLPLSA
jgi:hypothetical protein